MINVLVIGGRIEPIVSANVVCAENVFRALKMDDICVHFMGVGTSDREFKKNGIVYHIYKESNGTPKCLLYRLFMLPETDFSETKRKSATALDLHKKYDFQYIFGINCPFSNIVASINVKKQYPKICSIGFYLDILEGISNKKGLTRKIRDFFAYNGEYKAFSHLNKIFLPISSESIYKSTKYRKFNDRMYFFEFPSYISHNFEINDNKINKSFIKLVFIGTLDKEYRNPKYIIESLSQLHFPKDIIIDIYGRNDSRFIESELAIYDNIQINIKGPVSHEVIGDIYLDADAVLNISNDNMYVVPSKIFEIASYYRPMLILVKNKNDYANKYYNKYPGAFILYEYKKINDQLKGLYAFFERIQSISIDKGTVDNMFYKNTPEYLLDNILRVIE